MNPAEQEHRERLALLGEAGLHTNESGDDEALLQGVLESARQITGARYGVLIEYGDDGQVVDCSFAGMTAEEIGWLRGMPNGLQLGRLLSTANRSMSLSDFRSHVREADLPDFDLPLQVSDEVQFLAAPIRRQDEHDKFVGVVCLGGREQPFSADDEAALDMLTTQAAHIIRNAHRLDAARRSQAHLEAIVNLVPIGVLVFDIDTRRLQLFNREAKRLIGEHATPSLSIDELFAHVLTQRGGGRIEVPGGPHLSESIRLAGLESVEEFVIEGSNGRSSNVMVNTTTIRDDDGDADAFAVVVHDVVLLNKQERLRAEFLGVVGHELRTPLTSIKGSATTLLDTHSSLDPAEVVQYHRIIDEQADFMRDLIADLIDVVRIETGTLAVNPEACDVARLVDESRSVFLAAGGRDALRVSLAPDLPPVMAETRRVIQVLTNLLSNAERNSHETSIIQLDARHEVANVAISVTDRGAGLPAERLPHLFEQLLQGGSGQNRELGLGLPICKGIVEAHGGRIWAESDGAGLGSRFTFTLPVAEDSDSGSDRSAAKTLSGDPAAKPCVVAIDDDPRTLKLIRDTLAVGGHETVVSGDPTIALSLVADHDPDVVLLDLMLPGTDGIDLMRRILAVRDIPVIFLSAYDQVQLIERAFEMGAVDYIVKPFAPTELAARVKAALRKRAHPQDTFELDELTINFAGRTVDVAGRNVDLTPTEYGVLVELSTNAGIVLSHEHLLQRVWGQAKTGDARPLRTVIKNLRRHLGDQARNATYIQTIPHVGYRMPSVSAKPRAPGNETAASS